MDVGHAFKINKTINFKLKKKYYTMALMNFAAMRKNANANTTSASTSVTNTTPAPKSDAPNFKEVDVIDFMTDLKRNGQATLSDYVKPINPSTPVPTPASTAYTPAPAPTTSTAPEPKETPEAEQKAAQSASAKTDKNVKKKLTLIEPKDAFDARHHILEAAKSEQIVFELSEDQKSRIFADAPGHNVLWTLRKCFRVLGGEHNGEKENFRWIVPNDALINPNVAVATKSQKQLEYEQKVADGIIKPRTEQGTNEQTGKDKGTKAKFTEEQIIKLMRMVNVMISEDACRVLIKSLQ